MKGLRRLLQLLFLLANVWCFYITLKYFGAFGDISSEVESYITYAPTSFITVLGALIISLTTSASGIALSSLLIPLMPIVGCLLRSKARWMYRILVYPVLIFSIFLNFSMVGNYISILVCLGYFATAVTIDALP